MRMTTVQTMAVNFYGLTKIDFRLSENALWDACVAQWLIVSNEFLNKASERTDLCQQSILL